MDKNYIITAMYKKHVRVDGYERLVFMVRESDASSAVYRLLNSRANDDIDKRTVKVILEIPIDANPNIRVTELDIFPEDLRP